MKVSAPATHYPAATGAQQVETHTLSVLVDNEPGVLARVIGLFSGRGYNIESLTVAEIDRPNGLSRITIVTTGTRMIIEQIKAQLARLVPVHKVHDLTDEGPFVEREMALIKVAGKGEARIESLRLADIFRASVVDSTTEICLRADRIEREVERIYRADGAARTRRDMPHGRRRNLARPRELLTPRIPGDPGHSEFRERPVSAGKSPSELPSGAEGWGSWVGPRTGDQPLACGVEHPRTRVL